MIPILKHMELETIKKTDKHTGKNVIKNQKNQNVLYINMETVYKHNKDRIKIFIDCKKCAKTSNTIVKEN